MKLSVKNLGVVKSGEIQIEGITVLGGKNGTGKSTLGKALYSLGRAFYRADDRIREELERQLFIVLNDALETKIGVPRKHITRRTIDTILDEYYNGGKLDLQDLLASSVLKEYERNELEEKLKKILRISPDDILANIFSRTLETEFGGTVTPANNPRRITEIEFKKNNADKVAVRVSDKDPVTIVSQNTLDRDVVLIDDPNALDFVSGNGNLPWVLNRFSHRADLENKLLYQSADHSVISDILTEKSWDEMNRLINNMSGGEIVRRSNGEYVYKSPDLRKTLNIESLSTGLKSILLINTLLKNGGLNDTGLIILDEPEVHLHPEWQFGLARILVLLPKVLNIKIVLSTHSSDFLSAVNYYVNEYDMSGVTHYYHMRKEGDYSITEEVSDQLDLLYQELGAPFLKVAGQL